MKSDEILDLKHRLQNAKHLSHDERSRLYTDIERFAKHDLFGAAHLCKTHLSQKADFRLPSVIVVAEHVERRFEGHGRKAVSPVTLYAERDCQLRQPADCHAYQGPVVGTSPNCVIQRDKETHDFIVHTRSTLLDTSSLIGTDKSVSVAYPFRAIGGVGLVQEDAAEKQNEIGLEKASSHDRSVEPTRPPWNELERSQ